MDEDIYELSSDFLPNLNNEKTSEQLLFDSKVYHANEQFVRIRTDIIKWVCHLQKADLILHMLETISVLLANCITILIRSKNEEIVQKAYLS